MYMAGSGVARNTAQSMGGTERRAALCPDCSRRYGSHLLPDTPHHQPLCALCGQGPAGRRALRRRHVDKRRRHLQRMSAIFFQKTICLSP